MEHWWKQRQIVSSCLDRWEWKWSDPEINPYKPHRPVHHWVPALKDSIGRPDFRLYEEIDYSEPESENKEDPDGLFADLGSSDIPPALERSIAEDSPVVRRSTRLQNHPGAPN